jgi:hypothetical protein
MDKLETIRVFVEAAVNLSISIENCPVISVENCPSNLVG